jgi:hypothetical protein
MHYSPRIVQNFAAAASENYEKLSLFAAGGINVCADDAASLWRLDGVPA